MPILIKNTQQYGLYNMFRRLFQHVNCDIDIYLEINADHLAIMGSNCAKIDKNSISILVPIAIKLAISIFVLR